MLSPKASWKYVVMNFSDSAQRLLRTPYRLAVRYTVHCGTAPIGPRPEFEIRVPSRLQSTHSSRVRAHGIRRRAGCTQRGAGPTRTLLSLHAFTLATVQPPL